MTISKIHEDAAHCNIPDEMRDRLRLAYLAGQLIAEAKVKNCPPRVLDCAKQFAISVIYMSITEIRYHLAQPWARL